MKNIYQEINKSIAGRCLIQDPLNLSAPRYEGDEEATFVSFKNKNNIILNKETFYVPLETIKNENIDCKMLDIQFIKLLDYASYIKNNRVDSFEKCLRIFSEKDITIDKVIFSKNNNFIDMFMKQNLILTNLVGNNDCYFLPDAEFLGVMPLRENYPTLEYGMAVLANNVIKLQLG